MDTAQLRINNLLVNSVLPTCQLQIGMTESKAGSVWNTMPAHTHDRRMEVFLKYQKSKVSAILWGNHRKRATSGCEMSRPLSSPTGQFTQALADGWVGSETANEQ